MKLTQEQVTALTAIVTRQCQEAANLEDYAELVYDQDLTWFACEEAGIDIDSGEREMESGEFPPEVLAVVYPIERKFFGTTADMHVAGAEHPGVK